MILKYKVVVVVDSTKGLTELDSWKTLLKLSADVKTRKLDLANTIRIDPFWSQLMEIRLGSRHELSVNFARNFVTGGVFKNLFKLARDTGVATWRDCMFAGERINKSENRAVLHVALRNVELQNGVYVSRGPIRFDGKDVMPDVVAELNKLNAFVDKVRSGEWKGYTGKPIKKVVSIGIGGSDLGPRMATEALKRTYGGEIEIIYVSNIDGTDINDALKYINPEETLFIIESKSFTTQETITNAQTARTWFLEQTQGKGKVAKHFVAVSTEARLVEEFGIDTANMFGFWDWVGGRYSLPSAIGLPLMLSIGKENFADMLSGFQEVDEHFLTAPMEKNLPMILGLLDVWHINFMKANTRAVVSYDKRMSLFSRYLTQAYMESLGKTEDRDGKPISYETGYVLLPGVGTDDQHAWFQQWMQGSTNFPGDFIGVIENENSVESHHKILLANMLGQAEALANGDPDGMIEGTKFHGGRATNMTLVNKLTPKTLGMMIALWEHRIFVQGMVWGLNPFDQPGVQLGKKKAKPIEEQLSKGIVSRDADSVTAKLLGRIFTQGK